MFGSMGMSTQGCVLESMINPFIEKKKKKMLLKMHAKMSEIL